MFLISSYLLRSGWQLKIVGNNKMFNSCDKLVVRFSNWDETNYRCTWIIGLLQLLTDYICIAPTNDTNEAFVKMNHLGFCPHCLHQVPYVLWQCLFNWQQGHLWWLTQAKTRIVWTLRSAQCVLCVGRWMPPRKNSGTPSEIFPKRLSL